MSFTFSADNSKVLYGDTLFDGRTGQPIGRPVAEIGGGGSALSPDGERAASFEVLSGDGPRNSGAILWDISGRRIADLPQGEPVFDLKFTPDGRKLITVSPTFVRVWDARTGAALGKLPYGPYDGYCTGYVQKVTVTADSHTALIVCNAHGPSNNGYLWLADIDTLQQIPSESIFPKDSWRNTRTILPIPGTSRVVFSGSGSGSAGDYYIEVYDFATRKLVYRVGQHLDNRFGLSGDGRILVTRSFDEKSLYYWNALTGAFLRKVDLSAIPVQFFDDVFAITYDGTQLKVDVHGRSDDRTVWKHFLLNADSGKVIELPGLANGGIPYGENYVTFETFWGSLQAFVHSFDDGHVLRAFSPMMYPNTFVSQGDYRVMVPMTTTPPGWPIQQALRVFDFATGKLLHSVLGENKESIRAIAVSKNGRYALADADYLSSDPIPRYFYLVDLVNGRRLRRLDGQIDANRGLAFSPDGQYFVTLKEDKTELNVWYASSGALLRTIKVEGWFHQAQFRSGTELVYHYQGRPRYDGRFASINVETGVIGFDKGSDRYLNPDFTISPDGRRIFGEGAGYQTVWSAETGEIIYAKYDPQDWCTFAFDGNKLICTNTRWISIYDIATQALLNRLEFPQWEKYNPHAWLSPDGKLLRVGNRILDPDTLKTACRMPQDEYFQFLGDGQLLTMGQARRDLAVRECTTGKILQKMRIY